MGTCASRGESVDSAMAAICFGMKCIKLVHVRGQILSSPQAIVEDYQTRRVLGISRALFVLLG